MSHVVKLMKSRSFTHMLASLALLVTLADTSRAEQLAFNTAGTAPASNSTFTGFDDELARELFRRLGYTISFSRVPAQRALINVNEGLDDGTLSRIGGMSQKFPNLIALTEPVRLNSFSAFVRRADIKIADWSDLSPYDVAHIGGWKIVEQNLPAVRSKTLVKDVFQLMNLLERGRVSVAIVNLWGGLAEAREQGYDKIVALMPPLAQREMFFYLNRKHAALVPRASAELRRMKEDGTWLALRAKTVPFLDGR